MIEVFWQMLFLMLPAGVANMSPVFGSKIKILADWKTPVDLGYHFKEHRLFGQNKTWRGLFMGAISGAVIGLGQTLFLQSFPALEWINLASEHNLILLGFCLGLFALLGDLVESFFKRQANIPPGGPFFFFDQADYVLGAYFILLFFIPEDLSWSHYLIGLIVGIAFHPVISYLGYLLGLKKNKF